MVKEKEKSKHAFFGVESGWMKPLLVRLPRQIALISICSTEQTADLWRDDEGGAGKG